MKPVRRNFSLCLTTSIEYGLSDRALSIVNLLSVRDPPLAPSEISANLGLNKSTVHRPLTVLEHHRYVECDVLSGRYRLGLKLAKLGNVALSRFDLQRV